MERLIQIFEELGAYRSDLGCSEPFAHVAHHREPAPAFLRRLRGVQDAFPSSKTLIFFEVPGHEFGYAVPLFNGHTPDLLIQQVQKLGQRNGVDVHATVLPAYGPRSTIEKNRPVVW